MYKHLPQLQPQMLQAFSVHGTAFLQDAWCFVLKTQVSRAARKLVI